MKPASETESGVRRLLKWCVLRVFRALERLGIHVLPRHFYSPIADRSWLESNAGLWKRPVDLTGAMWDLDRQVTWLHETCGRHLHEVRGFSFLRRLDERGIEFRYGPVEAQVLYCAIRKFAPSRVIELGSGSSTALMDDAATRNAAEGCGTTRILSVDPYAARSLDRLSNVEVRRVPAQQLDPATFSELGPGDLLFVDSTHALKTGSELHRVYLEVIPGLASGVLIQIHDIYLPYLYSPTVLTDFWDWQESALLAALLTNNSHLETLCCQSALHYARTRQLQDVLPDYRPKAMPHGLAQKADAGHFPASIWLRSV